MNHLFRFVIFKLLNILNVNIWDLLAIRPSKGSKGSERIDDMTKEKLEQLVERAKKYNVQNPRVDAMKARLRKIRFEEGKK